jgi:peptide/nickel transport system substrate-binding protein
MPRRRLLLASPLALPALLALPVRAQGDQRPVLRVAVQALPPTLEPLEAISNVGLRITYNVFDTLWRRDFAAEARDGGQRLTPFLATSLEQRDALTWVATLRQGVALQDGGTLTAEDVLSTFSAERMWGDPVQTFEGRVNFGHLAGVEAEGPHRVVFRTRAPDPVMPQRLAAYGGWIHSARFYGEAGQAGMRRAPVGSGPYRVASFQRDQRVVLESHDGYWQGRPPARQVVFTVVPEASSRLAGLRAGDFDLVTNLLPEQAESLRGDARVEGVDVALDFAHILYYDTSRPGLADPRVRRALNHAVDCDMLGQSLWGPQFRRMAALQIPAFGDYYDATRPGFAYDPERARRLLREGGYRGEELVIRISPGYYLQMLQAVQAVQQMWQAVGIRTRLEIRENIASLTQPGADIRPTSIAFRFPDPLGGGLAVHLSEEYSLQRSGFWRPVRYNEIVRALREASEPAERQRLWRALLDEYEAEAPALILYPVREYFGKRRSIAWTHPPLYYMDFRASNLAFS